MLRYTAFDYTTKACGNKSRIFASLYLTDGSLSPELSFLNKSSPQTRFIAARRKELDMIRTEGTLFVIYI